MNYDDIVIALAGMIQSIHLMNELAKTGKINEDLLEVSINSLFQMNPPNALAVFGNMHHLEYGLKNLIQVLKSPAESRTTIKHMLSLMRLQKKISHSAKAMDLLTQRLHQAKKQADYFHLKHPSLIANLSDIYLDTISPYRFKIYISGNQKVFAIKENMEKIRTLLLTAIRASVLWRQSGGTLLQLIFYRERIKKTAIKLLNQH